VVSLGRDLKPAPRGARRHDWIPALFWSMGLVCLAAYHLIGSYVDEQGVLVEPFALIPLSWLFLVLGGVALLAVLLTRDRKQVPGGGSST
jgi:hypothetical protein